MHAVGELHTPPNFCPPGLKEAQAGLDSHDHFLSCKGSLRGMLTAVLEWWRVAGGGSERGSGGRRDLAVRRFSVIFFQRIDRLLNHPFGRCCAAALQQARLGRHSHPAAAGKERERRAVRARPSTAAGQQPRCETWRSKVVKEPHP